MDNNNTKINFNDLTQPPILNLTDCINLLKKLNNIPEEELILIKGSLYKEYEQYKGQEVIYQLFSTSLMKIISSEPCEKSGFNISLTDTLKLENLMLDMAHKKKLKLL